MNNTPNHQHNLGRAFVIIALLLATTFISDRFRSGPSTAQVDGVYRKIPSSEKPYVHAETRTINFSGYEWIVRANQEKQGPGPNYFNGSTESVWVDSEGNLHLKIRKIGDEWHCSEVYTTESFGYGSYIFKVEPGWTNLDENTVVGLFTYYNDTQEIDIEFARWGQEEAPNAQYALQPAGQKGNLHQFSVDRLSQSTIHSFTWCSKYVDFYSSTLTDVDAYSRRLNKSTLDESLMSSWVYTGDDIPTPRTERVHINFWLMSGLAPVNEEEAEVVVEEFRFVPNTCDKELPSSEEIDGFPLSLISIGFCIAAIVVIIKTNYTKNN